jgi:hypothetical protein
VIAIFILITGIPSVIQCIATVCQQVPSIPVQMMITAGTLELVFELGIVHIYAHKRRK